MKDNFSRKTISVIVPTYNSAVWIKETLDSILAQTYPIFEILVVDDGSTDHVDKLLQSYSQPVRYIRQEHSGVSAARNNGIRLSGGDLIAFIDADDCWHPRKIEAQIQLINERRCMWVTCETQPFDTLTGQVVNGMTVPLHEGDVLIPLFLQNFIGSATPLIHRSVFEDIGYFNEAYEARIGEDWDLWLRIASHYFLGVVYEKLAFQRIHSKSTMSSTSMAEKVAALEGVIQRATALDPKRLKPLEAVALTNVYHAAGVQLFRKGEYRDARIYFLRELKCFRPKLETVVYIFVSLFGFRAAGMLLKLRSISGKKATSNQEK